MNPAFCTHAARKAADGEGSYPLHALLQTPSGQLWAGGMYQLVVSRDRGATWSDVDSLNGRGVSTVKVLLGIEGLLVLFARRDGEIRVVRSEDEGRTWRVAGSLPDSVSLFAGVAPRASIIAAVAQDRDGVTMWRSHNMGATWERMMDFSADGALHGFQISETGQGLITLLGIPEFCGQERRTELVSVSCTKGNTRSTFVDHDIGGCVNVGDTQWLLGADGGMLFRYDSVSGALELEHALDDVDLSISSLDAHSGTVVAIGETSDPTPSVSLFLKTGDCWREYRTDLTDYVSVVKRVEDGVVLMTQTGLYKCWL